LIAEPHDVGGRQAAPRPPTAQSAINRIIACYFTGRPTVVVHLDGKHGTKCFVRWFMVSRAAFITPLFTPAVRGSASPWHGNGNGKGHCIISARSTGADTYEKSEMQHGRKLSLDALHRVLAEQRGV
jgi:hypothetical protein